MVLTVSFVLSPVIGSFVTVAPEKLASQELNVSIGTSRPHDFAVRLGAVRQKHPSRPPHPHPTSVTTAKRPSSGWDNPPHDDDLRHKESGKFFAQGWTAFLICLSGRRISLRLRNCGKPKVPNPD
jgi:hypothetical protein